jgi:hypothetical protein
LLGIVTAVPLSSVSVCEVAVGAAVGGAVGSGVAAAEADAVGAAVGAEVGDGVAAVAEQDARRLATKATSARAATRRDAVTIEDLNWDSGSARTGSVRGMRDRQRV